MKTFEEVKQNISNLPTWFTYDIFVKVSVMIASSNLLVACKFLLDLSGEQCTRESFGLRQAKDLLDYINDRDKLKVDESLYPPTRSSYPEDLVDQVTDIINDEIQVDYSTVGLRHLLSFVPKHHLMAYLEAN